MAYFARLTSDGIVDQVMIMSDSIFSGSSQAEKEEAAMSYCQALYATDARFVLGSLDGSIRKNPAAIGHRYYPEPDMFMPPAPYPSWVIDPENARWTPPVPMPNLDFLWEWDEAEQAWVAPAT
jgi:hypothetical protein